MTVVLGAEANALVLRRVAAKALDEARAAWTTGDDVAGLRRAFRASVLAASALRRASEVSPADASLAAQAKKLDDAASALKARLAKAIVDGE